MTATFTTRAGVRGHTSSMRRFVVVDRADAEILYRTDDLQRARDRVRACHPYSPSVYSRRAGVDLVDTHTGELVETL